MCADAELLTIAEVASLWKIGKRTVERMVANGDIPTVRIGTRVRIRADVARRISAGEPAIVETTSTERTAP